MVFKGLKAQYIAYMAAGTIMFLLLFILMYLSGMPGYACMLTVAPGTTAMFAGMSRASRKYGQYGLMKKLARKKLPAGIRITNRTIFQRLNTLK